MIGTGFPCQFVHTCIHVVWYHVSERHCKNTCSNEISARTSCPGQLHVLEETRFLGNYAQSCHMRDFRSYPARTQILPSELEPFRDARHSSETRRIRRHQNYRREHSVESRKQKRFRQNHNDNAAMEHLHQGLDARTKR